MDTNTSRESRRVSDSQTVLNWKMQVTDAFVGGTVHAGAILRLIDDAARIAATRHARRASMTAHVDWLSFLSPVAVGDVLTVMASVNAVGQTSMEVGVRVEVDDPMSYASRHIASAYLVVVALDGHRRPTKVPQLEAETLIERRRMEEALVRRERRSKVSGRRIPR